MGQNLLPQSKSVSSRGIEMFAMLFQFALYAAFYVATCYGLMKVFEKVDGTIPKWAAFVPFYNAFLLGTKVAGWEPVKCLLILIPIVGAILLALDVAKKFGKETGFAIGMGLLPFVFYPLLGMGDAQFRSEKDATLKRVV
jgi:hypothetical protein